MREDSFRPTRVRAAGRLIVLLDGHTERRFVCIDMPNPEDARFLAAAFADAFRRSKRDQTTKERI